LLIDRDKPLKPDLWLGG